MDDVAGHQGSEKSTRRNCELVNSKVLEVGNGKKNRSLL